MRAVRSLCENGNAAVRSLRENGNDILGTQMHKEAACMFPFSLESGGIWGPVLGRFPEKAQERKCFCNSPYL